ncbi:MAG: ABC transporter permease [Victivallaceae bacterium]|nr:ABC transporter permease [Victivallaceae bacterium]
MSMIGTIIVALKALRRNPMRAMLTTLGIVIGIAAVIAMMEIGSGSSNSIRKSIEKMGANCIMVMPGAFRMGGVSQGSGSTMSLTPEDCEAVLRECVNVGKAVPVVNARGKQAVAGNLNYSPNNIIGTGPDFLSIRNWEIGEGRAFSDREVDERSRVCLVGATIVRELFNGQSPIDCELRIQNVTFKVIGVLKSKGANMMGGDEDDVVIAPWTTVRLRVTGLKYGSATSTTSKAATTPSELYPGSGVALYPEEKDNLRTDTLLIPRFIQIDQIVLTATAPERVDAAIGELTALLRERHKLKPEDADDFWIRNSAEFMTTITNTSKVMTNLLLCVALISLVVGGVGIMNIMLVSVTERTREIGLRMAVGARSTDILRQFLIESITLCLVGGAIGIMLGHGAALLVESQLGWPIESSPGAVAAAVIVSAGVGIVFGFYPAWKASRLDPIDALHYE